MNIQNMQNIQDMQNMQNMQNMQTMQNMQKLVRGYDQISFLVRSPHRNYNVKLQSGGSSRFMGL